MFDDNEVTRSEREFQANPVEYPTIEDATEDLGPLRVDESFYS